MADTTRRTAMNKLEVRGFPISVDGFGAGADQRPEQPLGAGGERLPDGRR